jgi:oxygen-dependent protoporphyrinogen oxidase
VRAPTDDGRQVAIVGGGIAGLALACALEKRDRAVRVTVLEAEPRLGGNLRTEEIDGYVCEWGPNGFLDNVPETLRLVDDLGLRERLQVSDDRARKRFIYRRGRLHALPGGPGAFLTSGLLSMKGRLRVAGELFAARRPEGVDETIHAFASRRIGREAADVLVDSMVSGVFGGDARSLSLRACFPKMWQMETDHGGLFRALFAKMREKGRRPDAPIGAPAGKLTSFRGGIEELIRGAARAVRGQVRTGSRVAGLKREAQRFRLSLDSGTTIEADTVVLAGGAGASAVIVERLDASLAAELRGIASAPIAVVCLGWARDAPGHDLDGFGFLVPRGEGPRILGALWDSSIYPGRAPRDRVLVRVMIGGACDPGAVDLEQGELVDVVRRDLERTMGVNEPPGFVHVFRHRLGIPQYAPGHLDRLARIDALLSANPGLHLAGNAYRGVAINSCIADADGLADGILAGQPIPSTP